jgi:hypothetical protein
MDPTPSQPVAPAPPNPVFYRIAVRLLWALLIIGAAIAAVLAFNAKSINAQGGWGWLFAAGIFIAAAAVVFVLCGVCAAISLWRREPHQRKAAAFLIVACLVIWATKDIAIGVGRGLLNDIRGRTPAAVLPPPSPANTAPGAISAPIAGAVSGATIPDSLVEHFRVRGFVLKPAARGDGRGTEWIIEDADVGPQCEVVTSFIDFPAGTPVAAMEKHLTMISAASALNEAAALAMFYPYARGKTPAANSCADWPSKSAAMVERALDTFKSYRQAAIAIERR